MNRGLLLGAVGSALLICSVSSHAQDKGYWRAASSNANDITGDITISDARLTIEFIGYSIALIRQLTPAEASAVFDAGNGGGATGKLYRLSIPSSKRVLHKNTLCGSDETEWMATYLAGRTLHVAFFSGSEIPVLTPEALMNSTNVCGTFRYEH
jgi:hypothetical protein